MRRDNETIKDMVAACRAVRQFMVGVSEADFFSDEKTQSAVIHQLMIIGEAAKRLSDEFCRENRGVEWADRGAFRNILIHQYQSVELEQVWHTASRGTAVWWAAILKERCGAAPWGGNRRTI